MGRGQFQNGTNFYDIGNLNTNPSLAVGQGRVFRIYSAQKVL